MLLPFGTNQRAEGTMGDGNEVRQAYRLVAVLGEYEWEIENAFLSVNKYGVVDVWYGDEGERRLVATVPLNACFIEWESLEDLEGVVTEEMDEEDE
jgi:hypothetical protein